NIDTCLPISPRKAGPVRHQTSGGSKLPKRKDSRDSELCRECGNLSAALDEKRIRPDEQPFGLGVRECYEGSFDFNDCARVDDSDSEVAGLGDGLDVADFGNSIRTNGIDQHGYASRFGHKFLQKLDAFLTKRSSDQRKAGSITAGSIETRDQSCGNWIEPHDKDDWDRGCRNLGSKCSRWSRSDDQRNRTTNQVSRESGQTFILSVSKAIFDCNILTLDKTSFAQTAAKGYYLV